MAFGAVFLLRKSEYTVITLRLYQRDGAGFWYDLPKQTYLDNLEVGLTERDQSGRVVLEVLEVDRTLSSDTNHDTLVKLKIKTTYNKRTGKYSYDGLPLLAGNFYTFNLEDLELSGVILKIGDEAVFAEEKKFFVVDAYLVPRNESELELDGVNFSKINGVRNYIYEAISEGMEILDTNNNVIVKILEVDSNLGSREFFNGSALVKILDPERREVRLKILLQANKINDAYYYQFSNPLIIGGDLRLVFDNIILNPIITDVKEYVNEYFLNEKKIPQNINCYTLVQSR
jgi:hypothetical protein